MANLLEIIIHATTEQAEAAIAKTTASLDVLKTSATGAGVAMNTTLLASTALVAGAAIVATGAFVALGNRLSEQLVQTRNLSAATGISVDNLRVLQRVMIEAGKSPDVLNLALTNLKRNLDLQKPVLERMVGGTHDTMTALERMAEVARATGQSAGVAFEGAGIGARDLAAILPTLDDRIKDVGSRLGTLSKEAQEGGKAWDAFMSRMGTMSARVLDAIGGKFLELIDKIRAFLILVGKAVPALKGLGDFFAPGAEAPTGSFNFDVFAKKKGTVTLEDTSSEARRLTQATLTYQLEMYKRAHAVIVGITSSIAQGMVTGLAALGSSVLRNFTTIGDAIKQFFLGIADSIIAALAQIAASDLLIWVAGLLSGGGAFAGFSGFLANLGHSMAGNAGPAPRSPLTPQGGDIIINTLDVKSFRQSLTYPTGSVARALQQAQIGSRR